MMKENSKAVVEQPAPIKVYSFGSQPTCVHCDICRNKVTTTVEYKKGACTWLACVGISAVGGFLGCCLIPFYVNSCKDAHHICPECGTQLGVYKRI